MTFPATVTPTDSTRHRLSGPIHRLAALAFSLLAVAVFTTASASAAESPAAPGVSTFDTCSSTTEGYDFLPGVICGKAGATVAKFATEIRANGAETSWSVEYSETSAGGPWILVPGATGTITVAGKAVQFSGNLSGLTPEKTYYLRVKATNSSGTTEPIASFVTPAKPEAFAGQSVREITVSSARVAGSVIAHEQETRWRYEYATPADAEAGRWTAGPSGTISPAVGDNSYHTVEADLTGLNSVTIYYVRLFAENSYGHVTSSYDEGFQTAGAPTVSTFTTHAIHGESLRLLGSTSRQPTPGDTTTYHFEYVTKSTFEESGFSGASATPDSSVEGGGAEERSIQRSGYNVDLAVPAPEVVGQDLPELKSGETYVYRLVATDEDGTEDGTAQTLTVPTTAVPGFEEPCPNQALRTGPSAKLPACRAYEQVTPSDKEGAMDLFTRGTAGEQQYALVGDDGEHVMLRTVTNAIGANAAAFLDSYFFSRNGDGAWQMTSLTPQPEAGFDSYVLGLAGLFNSDLTAVGFTAEWTGPISSPEETFKVAHLAVLIRPSRPYRETR